MWDERYSTVEYAYGKRPNDFLAQNSGLIPKGKVLSLAEGEGRNAVYLAQQGCEVSAVDASLVGLQKATQLAAEKGVSIHCIHADLASFDMGIECWDAIISIFCPLPSAIRKNLYRHLVKALKPGGVFLLEAYTPAQIALGTGGGNNSDVMQTKASLLAELECLHFSHLCEIEREVIEGIYHTGKGAVVQAIACKK